MSPIIKVVAGIVVVNCVAVSNAQEERPHWRSFRNGARTGAGFVVNIPNQLGFCLWGTRPSGVSGYGDLKISVPLYEARDDFYEDVSPYRAENVFGDSRVGNATSWVSLNAALTYPLHHYAAVYAGLGYSLSVEYYQYYDRLHILSSDGHYWIEGSRRSHLNALGGVLVVVGPRIGFQLGAESAPAGATAGFLIIR